MFPKQENNLIYLVLNESKASVAQEFDEFCVKFVICVPGPSSEFHRGIEMGKHIYFAGRMLSSWLG